MRIKQISIIDWIYNNLKISDNYGRDNFIDGLKISVTIVLFTFPVFLFFIGAKLIGISFFLFHFIIMMHKTNLIQLKFPWRIKLNPFNIFITISGDKNLGFSQVMQWTHANLDNKVYFDQHYQMIAFKNESDFMAFKLNFSEYITNG